MFAGVHADPGHVPDEGGGTGRHEDPLEQPQVPHRRGHVRGQGHRLLRPQDPQHLHGRVHGRLHLRHLPGQHRSQVGSLQQVRSGRVKSGQVISCRD